MKLGYRAERDLLRQIWDSYGPWPELPREDPASISAEVADKLNWLNVEWITSADKAVFLSFLDTESGSEGPAWDFGCHYWDSVDFSAREALLKSNPYYSKSKPLDER